MTKDLDALPLPEPTWPCGFFGQLGCDAFTTDQIRAARREGYELAKCKTLNGVELFPQQPGQPHTMTICEPRSPEDGHWYSPDAVREIVAAELRKAQEGREPVAYMWQHGETGRTGFVDADQLAMGWQAANPRLIVVSSLYTSPPPKSDEARDALRGWVQTIRDAHDECLDDEHASCRSMLRELVNEMDAALAAQQKGGV
ncbi:MAG TPA: hypothetical protein VFM33_01135 [Aquabacterium sp.]|nr:hypothetical protein [Aquabacterium sp.]